MKRIIFYGVVVGSIVLLSAVGFCAPTGNPNDVQSPQGPGLFNMESHGAGFLKVGGDLDFILERELETGAAGISDLKVDDEHWYMAKISYNIQNRADVFVLLGGADQNISYNDAGVAVKAESSTDFAWGVGGKVFIYEFPDWKVRLSASGLYRHFEPDIDKITAGGVDMTGLMTSHTWEVSEWQVGGAISKEYPLSEGSQAVVLVPYIGLMYADSTVKGKVEAAGGQSDIGNAKNHVKVGMPLGADLLIGDNVSLNVEGEFFDEYAISTGLTIKL